MVDYQSSKDLHYLITRIINPILNPIIATLHSGPVVHYKDGTLDVTEYPIPELMAEFLTDWRDGLWYKYSGKNPTDVSGDILHEYMETINYVYRRPHSVDEETAKQVGRDLILLGQKIEEYLTGKVEVFSDFVFEAEKKREQSSSKKP
ncbi:hypothetical protein APY94_07035 [Thermococcus celericrescens]|uniref:Uncharacterized protein n=1 Tax=Thermococcus celericrescens TaxID=227598 RepID=A0A117IT76_9EURY|nr:hypothetical protein [Thermococcus celericrescens]KUH33154.1 hypothetical protein APY94_07035 [Thermococcus celericrescens]